MILQWKRRLLLGLGLAMTLGLVVGLPATASAVSTLTGETLNATGGPTVERCQVSSGSFSYTVSGPATGPYPGTFTETGSGTLKPEGGATLSASFTIHSGDFLITGSKNGDGGAGTACKDRLGNTSVETVGSYQATIHTPTGNYADQGASTTSVATGASGTSLFENFTSSLTQPVLIGPTSNDQCKNNGWKNFPQFKNQGQCVSSVQSQSQT